MAQPSKVKRASAWSDDVEEGMHLRSPNATDFNYVLLSSHMSQPTGFNWRGTETSGNTWQ